MTRLRRSRTRSLIAGLFDGPGNLGDGRRTGVKLDATAPLDAIGLKGGELRVKGMRAGIARDRSGDRRRAALLR